MKNLESRISSGEFVITSELTPPKGTDVSRMLETAVALKDIVHAFNVTDSHSAKMSLSPLAAAHCLVQQGVEPILQMTTRDRNRIAMQGDMLGAGVLGIRNLVCMGGDPPHLGDQPDAKPVFDLSTTELISAAKTLSNGFDFYQNKLNQAPDLHVGAVVNPGALDLDDEIARMEQKIDSGATFFQTQAIFDIPAFEIFMNRVSGFGVAIIAGVLPVKSVRMAEHMNANVPGIDVPADVIKAVAEADDVKAVAAELTGNIISALNPLCQGVHIMAIGWESLIPRILDQAAISNQQ